MLKKYHWINPSFKRYWLRFFIQTLFIVVFMFLVMLTLIYGSTKHMDVLSAIGASSIAASAFNVFALPSSPVAMPHRIFGSYIIAIISGMGWHFVSPDLSKDLILSLTCSRCLASALSAGTTMLLMALLDFEHPPAMGLALGLVMDIWNDWTLFVVLIAVLALCAIKILLRSWLIDLL